MLSKDMRFDNLKRMYNKAKYGVQITVPFLPPKTMTSVLTAYYVAPWNLHTIIPPFRFEGDSRIWLHSLRYSVECDIRGNEIHLFWWMSQLFTLFSWSLPSAEVFYVTGTTPMSFMVFCWVDQLPVHKNGCCHLNFSKFYK